MTLDDFLKLFPGQGYEPHYLMSPWDEYEFTPSDLGKYVQRQYLKEGIRTARMTLDRGGIYINGRSAPEKSLNEILDAADCISFFEENREELARASVILIWDVSSLNFLTREQSIRIEGLIRKLRPMGYRVIFNGFFANAELLKTVSRLSIHNYPGLSVL
ncbi:MAG: hypothetical protein GW908_09885 [Thiomicrospira sp.]|nr:hypothetical protein [Thiomicrospira sp.]NCN67712.1 hypothetical protein [Thiomicrospira sp.]